MKPPQVERALQLDRVAISALVSDFENQRAEYRARRAEIIEQLAQHGARRSGCFLGITGTPGSGKSTLIGELARRVLAAPGQLRVAVLAVDPSSHVSGGSLLGDRTRVRVEDKEQRLYFRSQASQTELGGLSPASFQVCRLLHYLFDIIFVETVGVGQNEIDIRLLADRVYLVMTPLGGDEVQFLKAGIMEIPDVVVLNKSDVTQAARKSFYALRSSLALARPFDAEQIEIVRTSCTTGLGLDDLAQRMVETCRQRTPAQARSALVTKEQRFFERWVAYEWGRQGKRFLDRQGGAESFLQEAGGFDHGQTELGARFRASVVGGA